MRLPTLDEQLADFYQSPRHEIWLGLRQQLFERDDFDPYAACWRRLDDHFLAGKYRQLLGFSGRLNHLGCLSPRFFYLVGVAAAELGHADQAESLRRRSRACLQAILQSGQGTEEEPFLTTYPWDSYDVLGALALVSRGQRLVDRDGIWCDVLTADDGHDYWFDVTDLIRRRRGRAKVFQVTAMGGQGIGRSL